MEKDIAATKLQARRAIEALRSGVPNADAISALGCSQPEVEFRFDEMMHKVRSGSDAPESSIGMLVAGDFGTGKSHLLRYLEKRALEGNFVCSRVVISKETPLFDLDKVFKSAVLNGAVPARVGHLVEEIALSLKSTSKAFADLFVWANNSDAGLHQVFPATLTVYEQLNDMDAQNEINGFWSGDKLSVPNLRKWLRDARQQQAYPGLRAPKAAELPPQRLRFLLELIKAAGYSGWVVLLDEIELVTFYSSLQRARSYAELARWMGQAFGEDYPGLLVVATVTREFAEVVLDQKGDRHRASQMLRDRNREQEATRAETGMRFLERTALPLEFPDDTTLEHLYRKLRSMHSDAYEWEAPEIDAGFDFQGRRLMRTFIRRWINTWDLLRLYPEQPPDIEDVELVFTRDEDPDLERASEDALPS